jgi:hypothetical protein
MAAVMFRGSDWIGFRVNHLSTMPVSAPDARAVFARQLIFIVFNSEESERTFK